jgi:hypothetical protein
VRGTFCPILGAKCWASPAARGIVPRAREEPTARNIHSRPRPLSPPFQLRRHRRAISPPPPHCRSAAPSPHTPPYQPERSPTVSQATATAATDMSASSAPQQRQFGAVARSIFGDASCCRLRCADHRRPCPHQADSQHGAPWCSTEFSQGMCHHRRAHFGMPGSCNDINVLQRSPLMTRLALREGPLVEFEANGHKYNYDYFLADDIYPRWQTFMKPVIQPRGKKQTQFTMHKRQLVKMWREHLGFCKPNLVYHECFCDHA